MAAVLNSIKLYKKHIRFFIVFFLFTLIVVGVRLYWIHKALPTKATVLYIDHTRFTRQMQYYPVVSYQTLKGEIITRGTYNLPINSGEVVNILYNPDDLQEFRLNTNYWLWYDIWSWYRMIWVAIAMYYLVFFIVKRRSRYTTQFVFETKNQMGPAVGFNHFKIIPISKENLNRNDKTAPKTINRLPKIVKVVLLLLLPVSIFLIGEIWDLPYTKQIAVVIFLGLVALGSPSGAAPDSDL